MCFGCRTYLIDLGATHGTMVNGKKAEKHKPIHLVNGSKIQFGLVPFLYRLESKDQGGDKRKASDGNSQADKKVQSGRAVKNVP